MSITCVTNINASSKILRTLFESLYDGTHPLRIALSKLQTLDIVRIIEGSLLVKTLTTQSN